MGQSSLLGVGIPHRIRMRLAEQERFNQEINDTESVGDRAPIRECVSCHQMVKVTMKALRGVKLFKCAKCRLPKYMRKLK